MAFRSALATKSAAVVATVAMSLGFAAPPARAVEAEVILQAAQLAMEAFKLFKNGASLDSATTKIINAINNAKLQIQATIERVTAEDVQACADAAVIKLAGIKTMSRDTKEAFAHSTIDCVTKANSHLPGAESKAAADMLGFALNVVGPIALIANAHVGFPTDQIVDRLITGNTTVISKLNPSCFATELWGDAEPGEPAEVILTCSSYHKPAHIGKSFTWTNRQPYDYTTARRLAMNNTSYNIAKVVKPILESL